MHGEPRRQTSRDRKNGHNVPYPGCLCEEQPGYKAAEGLIRREHFIV